MEELRHWVARSPMGAPSRLSRRPRSCKTCCKSKVEVSFTPSAPEHSSQHFWAEPISFPRTVLPASSCLREPKQCLALPRIILRFYRTVHKSHKSNVSHCQVSLLTSQTPSDSFDHFPSSFRAQAAFMQIVFFFFLEQCEYLLQGKLVSPKVHYPSESLSRHPQPCTQMLLGTHCLFPIGDPRKGQWGRLASRTQDAAILPAVSGQTHHLLSDTADCSAHNGMK